MKEFFEPARKIDEAVKILTSPDLKPTDVINSMKVIASATSELVNHTKQVAQTLPVHLTVSSLTCIRMQ